MFIDKAIMKLKFFGNGIFGFIVLFLPGLAVSKDITTEEYVHAISSAVHRVWPVLGEVWDTPVYRQVRLIVADGNTAWAIDSQSVEKIPYSEIRQRNLPSEYMYYQAIKWSDERPTIYVGLGETLPPEEKVLFQSKVNPVPTLFNIATHEAFHFFVQSEWHQVSVNNTDNDSRATFYPVQVLPRFYRNSIIRALYAALNGEQLGLDHARYWFEQWKKSYPDEVSQIRQTDIGEGSALYIEIVAEILAGGYRLNSAEFQHALTDRMKDEAGIIHTQSDSESYSIGALAGVILDMKKSEWKSVVAQGIPPLDILLEGVNPVKQPADRELESQLNQYISGINNKVGGPLETFGKEYNNPETIKIFISSALSGSYSVADGFFRIKSIPYELMAGVTSSGEWKDGTYTMKDIVAAVINDSAEYKGEHGFLVLYNGALPSNKDGRLILSTDKISLNIPYPEDVEKSRVIYLP